ncbi:MAG: hypothetical protein WCK97_09935 [Actinomycetes bacterium]
MRRPFTHWGGQRLLVNARSKSSGGLGIGVLLIIGALHLAAVMLLPSARAYLSPRFTLVIAAVFLGLIAVGTMSTALMAMLLCVAPTVQLGVLSAAGIAFNPTLILGTALSFGLLLRLFTEQVIPRSAWTVTGQLSFGAVIAAPAAVVLSSIMNGESLLNCAPWIVAFVCALSIILSSRFGYLRARAIPVILLIGFAISATSDLLKYFTGTAFETKGLNAGRFLGGMGDYELLGEFYAVAIIIALATLIHVRRLAVSILALYVIGLGLILIFATQSRSPIITLAIACPLVVIAPLVGNSVPRSRVAIIIAVGASIGMALLPLISSSKIVGRLLEVSDKGDFARTLNRSSVWPRVVADPTFRTSGLFGNGPTGMFEWYGTFPHNLVLWTIWSLGIIGCIFVALLAATGISEIVQWRKHNWVAVTLGLSLVALLVDQTVIEFPREGSMILFVLALCALVGAASISEGSDSVGHSTE